MSIGTNNGGVAIDITTIGIGTRTTDQPVGIPDATIANPGNDNTFWMFRFRTQVKLQLNSDYSALSGYSKVNAV